MMVYIFISLFLCVCTNVNSLTLSPIGNATIETKLENVTIDQMSYEKIVKDDKQSISLKFRLEGESSLNDEKLDLSINDEIIIKTADFHTNTTHVENKAKKIYIFKEPNISYINYTVGFLKIDNIINGLYKLIITANGQSLSAESKIFSPPIITKFPKPKLGLEGDPMRINCVFEAYPAATEIIWERLSDTDHYAKANKTQIMSDERIEISSGRESKKENDTLYIKNLLKSDSGFYACRVKSILGEDISVTKINVKDRWAALYPFIGIVIEVILLVTAILAYEKYQIRSQNKKNYGGDNIDEDNKEPGIPLATGGGDDENPVQETNDTRQSPEVDVDKMNSVDGNKQRDTAITKNV